MYGKKFATVCVIGLTGWIVANSGEVPNANGVTANGPVVAAIEAPTLAVPAPAIESSFVVQRQDELAWSRGRIAELEVTVKDLEAQIMRLTTPQASATPSHYDYAEQFSPPGNKPADVTGFVWIQGSDGMWGRYRLKSNPRVSKSISQDAYQKPQQFRSFSSCSGPGCGQSSGGVFSGGSFRPFGGVFRRR